MGYLSLSRDPILSSTWAESIRLRLEPSMHSTGYPLKWGTQIGVFRPILGPHLGGLYGLNPYELRSTPHCTPREWVILGSP